MKIIITLLAFSLLLASCGSGGNSTGTQSNNGGAIVQQASANYKEYSAEVVSNIAGTKVLFFGASWCPACRKADKNFMSNSVSEDITVIKVDYDTHEDLRQKYGVTSQHTYVQVDSDGNMLAKWSGSKNYEDVLKKVVSNPEPQVVKEVIAPSEEPKITVVEESTPEQDEEVMVKEEVVKQEKGGYKESSSDTFMSDIASMSGNNVLFFHAAWCPSCRTADNNLASAEVPAGLNIFKIDYDNSTDLKKKYGVTGQHTFVQVDSEGNMLKKWSGGKTVEDVVKKVQ